MASRLVQPDLSEEVSRAMLRRIVVAQSLYAFGALLCVVSTYWGIGFVILAQLNYAVGPRIGVLSRI